MRVCLPRFGFVFCGIGREFAALYIFSFQPFLPTASDRLEPSARIAAKLCCPKYVLQSLFWWLCCWAKSNSRLQRTTAPKVGVGVAFYSVVWIIASSLCSGIGFYLWLCVLYVWVIHMSTHTRTRSYKSVWLAFPLRQLIMYLISRKMESTPRRRSFKACVQCISI